MLIHVLVISLALVASPKATKKAPRHKHRRPPAAKVVPRAPSTPAPMAPLVTPAPPPPKPAEPPPPVQKKMAVLELDAVGVPLELAKSASVLLPNEVRSYASDYQVVSPAELGSMMGFERQRQLVGCQENSECMAEIAGALGVSEMISGRLSRLGETYIIELRRSDVNKAKVLASQTRNIKGKEEAVIAGVRVAVAALFGKPPPADTTIYASDISTASEARSGKTRGLIFTSAGAVVVAAGAVGIVMGLRTAKEYRDQQPGGPNANNPTLTRAEAERTQLIYTVSWVAAGLGAASLGYGIYELLHTPKKAEPTATIGAIPLPGGAMLVAGGSY